MANKDRPAGLIPVAHATGGTPQRMTDYRIADGYGTSLYRGDLVKSTGTGKQIAVAGATDKCVGVFAGCQYFRPDGSVVYSPNWPASTSVQSGTEVTAHVYDDPGTLFEVQVDGDLAEADIAAMGDSINTTGGDDATGVSGMELDNTSIAVSAKQIKIMDLVRRADNDFGAFAKVRVLISKHELRGALTAV